MMNEMMDMNTAEVCEMVAVSEAPEIDMTPEEIMEMQEMERMGASEMTEEERLEQQEMDDFAQAEADEGGKLGYSSDYYEHQAVNALKNGNKIAYENAMKNMAREVVREETRKMKG